MRPGEVIQHALDCSLDGVPVSASHVIADLNAEGWHLVKVDYKVEEDTPSPPVYTMYGPASSYVEYTDPRENHHLVVHVAGAETYSCTSCIAKYVLESTPDPERARAWAKRDLVTKLALDIARRKGLISADDS